MYVIMVYSTGFFDLQSGVRQGCPLSPYLFLLVAEVFALKIKMNSDIKGININNNEIKLTQYADDTTVFLDGSKRSIIETVSLFNELKEASGLSINFSKSNLFPLGPFVNRIPFATHDLQLSITQGPVHTLGIFFTSDTKHLFSLNYMPKLSRLKSCLRMWSSGDLTPIGRNIIVKTFALLQLVFLFQVLLNPPNHFVKDLERFIFNFIWNGNPDKIKRSVMINTVSNGGLKVTHIQSFINSLKCTWVRHYCNETDSIWKQLFDFYLKPFGKQFIFQCNFAKNDVKSINNSFIREIVETWRAIVFTKPNDNFGSQIIWNNSHVRINGNIVMYKQLFENNVIYVRDLFNQNNSLLSLDQFKRKYQIESIPFTVYWGLVHAIPHNWRSSNSLRSESSNTTIDFYNSVLQALSVSQFIYTKQLKVYSKAPTSKQKWEYHFNAIEDRDWIRFFSMPRHTVSKVKLQCFQFEFLHRIITTDRLLNAMGKCDSDLCTFCETASESIEHLFWECSVVASFILDVESQFLKNQFFFSKQDIFLGYGEGLCHPYNFLILHLKFFIYECKGHGGKPTIDDFFYKFKFALNIERQQFKSPSP